MLEKRRVLHDMHGSTHFPDKPEKLHTPKAPLTPKKIERLFVLRDQKDLEALSNLIYVVDMDNPAGLVSPVARFGLKWILDQVEKVKQWDHEKKFFKDYHIAEDTETGLQLLNTLATVTYASGTPSCCAEPFVKQIRKEGLALYLDSAFPIILNPVPWRVPKGLWPGDVVTTSDCKLIDAVFFEVLEGRKPIIADDHYPTLQNYSFLLGGESILLLPMNTEIDFNKILEPHFQENLKSYTVTGGTITPVSGVLGSGNLLSM